jgi:hypothetical protein
MILYLIGNEADVTAAMQLELTDFETNPSIENGDELPRYPDVPRHRGAKRAGVPPVSAIWCLMRTRVCWRTGLAALMLCAACASQAPQTTTSNRLDRTVITRDQMLQANYTSVYDAVAALRSVWLRPRTAESVVSTVWVYVDNARVGDVDVLKTMQPRLVNTVRYYDGPSATSRWGVDHAAGVIHVSTWSAGAAGMTLPDSTRRRPPDTSHVSPDGVR